MSAILKVNGQPEPYPEHIGDLENLLIHIMESRSSREEIIIQVKLNGRVFSEAYDHQARRIAISEMETIHVSTVTAEWFSRRFIDRLVHYLDHLEKGFRHSIRLLRCPGEQKNGFALLAGTLDTLSALQAHLRNVWEVMGSSGPTGGIGIWSDRELREISRMVDRPPGEMNPRVVADWIEGNVLPMLGEWKNAA